VVVDLTGSGQIKLQQIDKFKSERKNIYKPKKIANPEWYRMIVICDGRTRKWSDQSRVYYFNFSCMI
jgi:hypothetical protein